MPFPCASDGRYRIKLEDTIDSIALGDSGSDWSAIPVSIANEISSAVPDVDIVALDTLFDSRLPSRALAATRSTLRRLRKPRLRLLLSFRDPIYQFASAGVPFLVVDQPMEEVLLGRPFLKAIGFDLESHLEKVGRYVDGKHMDVSSPLASSPPPSGIKGCRTSAPTTILLVSH